MKFSRTGRLIVSEESMEYCQFNCSWSNNQTINYVAKYSLLQTRDEWVDNDLNADDLPASESEVLHLSCKSSAADACELMVTCKPHYNVSIQGICIVSEARTVECYSKTDGYIQSSRGVLVEPGNHGDDSEDDIKLYHCGLKLEEPESEITLKFLSLGDRTTFRLYKLKFVLLQGEGDNSLKARSGNIDVSKVKGYLHSMGDSVPNNAMELLQSVEQFQKTQMSGLQGIQNMFGGLNLGQTDGLSGLLSVVSKLGPMTNDRQKSHHSANSQKDQCDQSISPPFSSGRLNSDIKPLENLARSLSQGEDQSQFEGQDGDMMYKMLQNICGSVSKMRDVKVRQDEKTTQDDVHFQQRTENSNCQETTDDESKTVSAAAGMNSEELQIAIQETVSKIFMSTEQRLKDYIDSSLVALEDRISQKFDTLLQTLVKKSDSINIS